MSSADVCSFCNKKIDPRSGRAGIRIVRDNTTSVTVFRCVNASCTHRFHASCVHEQLGSDASIAFDCPQCSTRCTARAPRHVLWSALRSLWCKYPSLLPDWFYASFVINRCLDLAAFVVGLLSLVVLYSVIPYMDNPSQTWPTTMQREMAEHIAYTVMPEQLHELRAQAADPNRPTLAVATCAAAWICGWMCLSAWSGVIWAGWSLIRGRNSRQFAKGVILE